jgi:uncharacterized repeat protein (TIGR01451 family)
VQAVPGNTVNYKITVTNNTTTPATNVVVTDVLAPGQTLVISPTLTSPSCTFTGPSNPALSAGTVTCSIGTVSQGTPQSVAITTVVNQGFSGNLTNQASVTSSNLSGPPSNVTVVQVPTTVPVVTTGTLVLCGTVTAFLTNSITVGGTTIVIAPGATITGSTIALTGNFCIIFTLNTAGQATAMVVTPNLALTNVVCGVFTVGTTAGTVIVGGIPLVVIGGATFPAVLVPGQVYCFVLNAAGQAVAVLTTIPTSIRIVPARLSAAEIRTGYQMTRLSRVIDDV